MPEVWLLLLLYVLAFGLGFAVGVMAPLNYRLPLVGRCRGRESGEHEFIHLRGGYGYCHYCTARKRFIQ